MKPRLLAIIGSQRKNGNSYSLAKAVFDSVGVDSDIVQLADREIKFCTVCEKCVKGDCVLRDDLNEILTEMQKADGIVFVLPKYLFSSSKFLAFLERLDGIVHMRRHMGYCGPPKNPDYTLFSKKPFGIFALSGRGKFPKATLRTVKDYIESTGLTPVLYDSPPFIAVNVKSGDEKGEVLGNKAALKRCIDLTQKVIASSKTRQ
jgi:multimeric flavodoxin WrbA